MGKLWTGKLDMVSCRFISCGLVYIGNLWIHVVERVCEAESGGLRLNWMTEWDSFKVYE